MYTSMQPSGDEINVICNLCGGSNFYKELGHYYCGECQTQTQEIQEHEYATEQAFTGGGTLRREVDRSQRVTSWEYYNYILLGLTEELIQLGASETIKPVVMYLWMQYLEQMEVISKSKNALPKLGILNNTIDAEIIYGKPITTINKKRQASTIDSDSVISCKRRKKATKMRALKIWKDEARAQQSDEGKLLLPNETLTSLKSIPGRSASSRIKYNTSSMELLSHLSKRHLKRHREDCHKKLTCHKLIYKTVSPAYCNSAKNLSISKLYSLLYLAVLINGDDLTIADMLRFIKEGHLSFNSYGHFFPENYLSQNMRFGRIQRNRELVNRTVQRAVVDLAKYLNVTSYMVHPDFSRLCDRYCKELNLPDQISQFARSMVLQVFPKMVSTPDSLRMPNYEAKVLSIIIIVLKLIFGLDGVSEVEISKHANMLARYAPYESRSFDILAWLKYLQYRRIILMEHYFPSQFDSDTRLRNTNQFVDFNQTRGDIDHGELSHKVSDKFQLLLGFLKKGSVRCKSGIHFSPSLTPFTDYIEMIINDCKAEENNYQWNILSNCFASYPVKFLNNNLVLNKNLKDTSQALTSDANHNVAFKSLMAAEEGNYNNLWSYHKKNLVDLKIDSADEYIEGRSPCGDEKTKKTIKTVLKKGRTLKNSKIKDYKVDNEFRWNSYVRCDNHQDVCESICQYNKLLGPYKKYWLKYSHNINDEREFNILASQLPGTFQIVLKECAKICEQSLTCFLKEFQLTESYVLHNLGYIENEEILEKVLRISVGGVETNW